MVYAPSKERRAWYASRAYCKMNNTSFFNGWNTFDRFLHDMGPAPSGKYKLSRMDLSKGFTPSNCRWKRRSGAVSTIDGKRYATPEYRCWQLMRDRCLNSENPKWYRYGGRGITICKRWDDFNNFFEDMGLKPTDEHTIERVDTDGNYTPDNCVWDTRLTQSRNRSYCVDYSMAGRTMKSWEWAEFLGVSKQSIYHYVYSVTSGHWSEEHRDEIIEKKLRERNEK